MLEMFDDGSIKGIRNKLVEWGASSVTAEVLMSVFDSFDNLTVPWNEFEQTLR